MVYYLKSIVKYSKLTKLGFGNVKGEIEEMLDLLPDTTRHVLEECYLNHKKYREVADEMNVCQET